LLDLRLSRDIRSWPLWNDLAASVIPNYYSSSLVQAVGTPEELVEALCYKLESRGFNGEVTGATECRLDDRGAGIRVPVSSGIISSL
jgi:hypothetical protein